VLLRCCPHFPSPDDDREQNFCMDSVFFSSSASVKLISLARRSQCKMGPPSCLIRGVYHISNSPPGQFRSSRPESTIAPFRAQQIIRAVGSSTNPHTRVGSFDHIGGCNVPQPWHTRGIGKGCFC
jgi:hypothetical protein